MGFKCGDFVNILELLMFQVRPLYFKAPKNLLSMLCRKIEIM